MSDWVGVGGNADGSTLFQAGTLIYDGCTSSSICSTSPSYHFYFETVGNPDTHGSIYTDAVIIHPGDIILVTVSFGYTGGDPNRAWFMLTDQTMSQTTWQWARTGYNDSGPTAEWITEDAYCYNGQTAGCNTARYTSYYSQHFSSNNQSTDYNGTLRNANGWPLTPRYEGSGGTTVMAPNSMISDTSFDNCAGSFSTTNPPPPYGNCPPY